MEVFIIYTVSDWNKKDCITLCSLFINGLKDYSLMNFCTDTLSFKNNLIQ